MSVGRGNRKTKKLHAAQLPGVAGTATNPQHTTACGLPQSRRYVRHPASREEVNCNDCLRALVDACGYAEFLARAGFASATSRGHKRIR